MSGKSFALAISAALVAWPASATVTISSAGTQNMTCSSGVCSPTAVDANLNVADLKNLLASGNVAVTTTGSGVQANDIDVTAKIVWRGTALTLDAYHSLSVSAPVVAKGKSGLSLLT